MSTQIIKQDMAATVHLLTFSQAGSDSGPLPMAVSYVDDQANWTTVPIRKSLSGRPPCGTPTTVASAEQELSFRSDPPCLSCSLSNVPQEKHCFFFFHLCPLSSGPACGGPRNVNFKLCRARLSTLASSGHWAW